VFYKELIFILEINKIYNMDCLDGMDLMIGQGLKVDAIITDPPYGTTACKWDTIIPFTDMWLRLKKLRKENSPILLFGIEPFSSYLRISNIKEYKYDWTWIKNQATNHLHAKHMPMRKTENISVFFKKSSWYNPQKTTNHIPTNSAKGCSNGVIYHGENKRNYKGGDTTRMPLNIQYFKCVDNYSKLHPNEKPVSLIEYLITTHTNENDLILDFTIGSGTTAIACINTNRNYIGFELDENYYKIANERIKNHLVE